MPQGRRLPPVRPPASGPYHWNAWPVTAPMHSKSRSRYSRGRPRTVDSYAMRTPSSRTNFLGSAEATAPP